MKWDFFKFKFICLLSFGAIFFLAPNLVLGQEKNDKEEKEPKITIKEQAKKVLSTVKKDLIKFREGLALKAGVGMAYKSLNGNNNTEDNLVSYGLNAQFGYSHKKWEFNLSSYTYFGKLENVTFNINNQNVRAQGSVRSLFFAPMLKYTTDAEPFPHWHLYFTGGPAWSIQSFGLDNFIDHNTGQERRKHRLNYESRGAFLGLGFQEVINSKELKPVYVEFLYSHVRAYKMTLVDASNYKEVLHIASEDTHLTVFESVLMVNMGLLLF